MSFKTFQELGYDLTDAEIKAYEKQIIQSYKEMLKELEASIKKGYSVLAGITPENGNYYNEFLKHGRKEKLFIEISQQYNALYKQLNSTVSDASKIAITNNYYRQLYSMNWLASELKFVAIPDSIVELSVYGSDNAWKAITKSIADKFGKDQYKAAYGTLSDLLQKNKLAELKQIQTIISQGLQAGKSAKDLVKIIASTIGGVTEKEASGYIANALRIIRTETNRAMNDAAYASQKAAEDQGIDIKKMWSATLDAGTRPVHGHLDGQIREISKPFDMDGYTVMRPGQFGVAKQDINCRCTTVDIINDTLPTARRGRNPITGENEVFSYKDFNSWAEENGLAYNKSGRLVKI